MYLMPVLLPLALGFHHSNEQQPGRSYSQPPLSQDSSYFLPSSAYGQEHSYAVIQSQDYPFAQSHHQQHYDLAFTGGYWGQQGIQTGGGHDQAYLSGYYNQISAHTAAGNDWLELTGAHNQARLNTARGDDQVFIDGWGHEAQVYLGAGNDFLSVNGQEQHVIVYGGEGYDTVQLQGAEELYQLSQREQFRVYTHQDNGNIIELANSVENIVFAEPSLWLADPFLAA